MRSKRGELQTHSLLWDSNLDIKKRLDHELPLKIKVSLKILPPVCFALDVPKKSITSLWIAGFLSIYWLPQRWFSSREFICQCRRHVFDPWPLGEPTCHGATKPGHRNYRVLTLELRGCNCWARGPQLWMPVHLEPMLYKQEKPPQWEAHALQLE